VSQGPAAYSQNDYYQATGNFEDPHLKRQQDQVLQTATKERDAHRAEV